MATMKDPGVVKRVIDEKEELDAKLEKLKAFIASRKIDRGDNS